ncbi:preprotein translocase subunit YajC [bacterium]|jgi:preprotein translocase subunit YajC|nr:preprotein translocase subunit YajC [bacterium]
MSQILYALGQAPQQNADTNPIFSFLPFALIIIVFYFFLIRPQAKKQKEQAEMLKTLKKDDEVVTNGGLYGKIISVEDKTVTVKFGNNQPIKVVKSLVTKVSAEEITKTDEK